MKLLNNRTLIGERKMKKLEKILFSKQVKISQCIWDWEKSLTVDELNATIAHDLIPIEEVPGDMVDPWDILKDRLPMEAFTWAKKHVAHALKVEKKDATENPSWVLLAIILNDFAERREKGLTDSLPPGEAPLKMSDFVVGELIKEHPDDEWGFYRPAKNYRRRPKTHKNPR